MTEYSACDLCASGVHTSGKDHLCEHPELQPTNGYDGKLRDANTMVFIKYHGCRFFEKRTSTRTRRVDGVTSIGPKYRQKKLLTHRGSE